ncbi:male sterility protein-domain-containing protein [Sporodiniella umbellata]|nr:male sterility protein-domain-containing protein [Sporodiniella umbellata]
MNPYQTHIAALSSQVSRDFLVQSVAEVLKMPLSDLKDYDKSVFDLGLNSSTVVQLRNTISQKYGQVPQNFLYENPTFSAMQKALINTQQAHIAALSSQVSRDFLVQSVAEVLKMPLSDLKDYDKSVFDLGLNSSTAVQLRNIISQKYGQVPQNFLYENPTFSAMQKALASYQYLFESDDVAEKRYQETQSLAELYVERAKRDFSVVENNCAHLKRGHVVMLTGATGSLGSNILQCLLQNQSVKKIYCLVRGKESDLKDRVLKSFESNFHDTSLLNTERLEVLPMRLSEPNLGFTKKQYEQLKEEVTIVQHCAWLVDFNMTISHFDKECIAPFYNLLKFAYRPVNPICVHFISSITASASMGSIVEEKALPFNSHISQPMGYGQSKFVCEILLSYLVKEKNFPCFIERVGQLMGDTKHGVWNAFTFYPLVFTNASHIHKVPRLPINVDWLPVDCAAAVITDIMLRTAHMQPSEENSVYNVVHPDTQSWSEVLRIIESCGISSEVVDFDSWKNSIAEDATNPAYRLMGFYEVGIQIKNPTPSWETTRTEKFCQALSQLPKLDSDLLKKYLSYWRSVDVFKTPDIESDVPVAKKLNGNKRRACQKTRQTEH